ncbi:MAG: hypothetical protein OXT69_07960 [Candidatus Poribacteria bacterium]|nr:hypothetical protein [Candidatus Poribacteria bacterium]
MKHHSAAWAAAFIFTAFAAGCGVSSDDPGENYPPAAPRGVHSISGSGQVTIVWYPNTEPDLAGYQIWRSLQPGDGYRKIATVGADASQHVDMNLENGTTYYYAVLAFDHDGNESEFNPEVVEDTPRPEGKSVTLRNYREDPSRAGFAFRNGAFGPVRWDADGDDLLDRDVDIFFGRNDEFRINYIYSDHDDLLMQDLGYRDSLDEVDVAPLHGYTVISVEALPGHVYAFFTPDGNYAKIRVTRVSSSEITFDWAYQLQQENADLAPPLTGGSD